MRCLVEIECLVSIGSAHRFEKAFELIVNEESQIVKSRNSVHSQH